MEIKTKYNIGDEVYFQNRDSIEKLKVVEIDIKIKDCKRDILYWAQGDDNQSMGWRSMQAYCEEKLYATPEEVLEHMKGL